MCFTRSLLRLIEPQPGLYGQAEYMIDRHQRGNASDLVNDVYGGVK